VSVEDQREQPAATQPPLSPDGRYYWDGSQWLPVPVQPYGTPGAAWGPLQQTGTDGLAIASLVLGIVWLGGIGSILAVVFGHIARRRIRRTGQSGRGLALAGLILGYIGFVVAALIIAAIPVAISQNHKAQVANTKARVDIMNVAKAEENYLVDNSLYTMNVSDLAGAGFSPDPDTSILLDATANDYCIVGSATTIKTGRLWYLYGSRVGGFVAAYRSKAHALAACVGSNPGDFVVLSGDGS
jgi:hypothetical protein